jgi:hypothetical protein
MSTAGNHHPVNGKKSVGMADWNLASGDFRVTIGS